MGTTAQRRRACAWCGTSLEDGEQLSGRTRCRKCGAATTDPWPSDTDLRHAYGGWYRPTSGGRFAAAGDLLLHLTRSSLARRVDRIAPPGPVLDVGRGTVPCWTRFGVVGERQSGWSESRGEPTSERETSSRSPKQPGPQWFSGTRSSISRHRHARPLRRPRNSCFGTAFSS